MWKSSDLLPDPSVPARRPGSRPTAAVKNCIDTKKKAEIGRISWFWLRFYCSKYHFLQFSHSGAGLAIPRRKKLPVRDSLRPLTAH